MTEYSYCLLIPKDRIGVLIGKGGSVKRKIEQLTGAKIEVDSKTGEVCVIRGEDAPPESIRAIDVIKAIARGFSPEKALKLLDPNVYLEIIDITYYVGDSPKALKRVRGRIIGTKGKALKYIAELTKTDIQVYGKTVCIIGEAENIALAREAILRIIQGSPHNTVYRWLERRVQEW